MLEESLRLRRLMDDTGGSVWSLVALSLVVAELGELERATVILGATDSMSAAAGTVPSVFPELTQAVADCERRATRSLGASRFEKARARGKGLDVAAAIAFALEEQAPAQTDQPPEWSALTPREREVAQLVAEGMSNRGIAAKLVISERTAEGHVEKILTKLSYTSRTQIAAWVADHQQEGSPHTT
jgi:non-specific serine/threonine protein kinase